MYVYWQYLQIIEAGENLSKYLKTKTDHLYAEYFENCHCLFIHVLVYGLNLFVAAAHRVVL